MEFETGKRVSFRHQGKLQNGEASQRES